MTLEEHFALVREYLHDPEPLESLRWIEHALDSWREEAEDNQSLVDKFVVQIREWASGTLPGLRENIISIADGLAESGFSESEKAFRIVADKLELMIQKLELLVIRGDPVKSE